MTSKSISHVLSFKPTLLSKARKHNVPVILLIKEKLDAWLKKQPQNTQAQVKASSFQAKPQKTFLIYDDKHKLKTVLAGISEPYSFYEAAHVAEHLSKTLPDSVLKKTSFTLDTSKKHLEQATLAWILASYSFDAYQSNENTYPVLVVDKSVDKKRVITLAEAISIERKMVNTPANDMGPAQIESCVKKIATKFKAKIKVTSDKELIKNNFPLVYTVGEAAASDRRPRLIDLKWGNAKHPKITLVGKGVAFDTGGLNIKPTQYMAHMKKDMGGAAHALGVAYMIMAMNLPVRLRLLIPAVENSISGPAFRPGDVIKSRSGIQVENTNTDAEGRLILADSLAYACEEKPELIIDFATLTGSARAALGHDIPAMFATNDKHGAALQKISFDIQDPVWQMPLYEAYYKHIKSSVGDIVNSAGIPGDLIYSALFLKKFVEEEQDWIHLDCFAWESTGQAGRPKGGSDTGLRAVYTFLEGKYDK